MAPEHGIHVSLQRSEVDACLLTRPQSIKWAQAIVPQDIPLLKLPVEVRENIWYFVLNSLSYRNNVIRPVKKSKKFTSVTWPDAARETAGFYEVCRQMYVDIVGGALFYKFNKFAFRTPKLMDQYLSVINPCHKDAIKSIQICFPFGPGSQKLLPAKSLKILAGCEGLKHLSIQISIDLTRARPQNGRAVKYGISGAWLKMIRECKLLREIKGLKSFDLIFSITRYYFGNEISVRCEEWQRDPRVTDLANELRKDMLT